ncbi:ABC transporter ATP-binding protein [Bradyrhizobium sp. NP1]|uniref:ABC transporter ATP-binding protein n=1 Tax=Bradyrhizobium sp. NP1 TaxID=3049772 RepID=UPI0025A4F791|nr:ABC transporter ATP-binding protein [Bradyrhizobium sp. NP1]WJR77262.1 ABC transporter ATP-binding protein [Bradyrhizobium sp. NP1]
MTHPLPPLLAVRNLCVLFDRHDGPMTAVHDVSFELGAGEILGLVGESGAGKSLTSMAIAGLVDFPGRISATAIELGGRRIDHLAPQALRHVRGREIGVIFQDPLTSLDPLFTIGDQLVETIRVHLPLTAAQAQRRALDLLRQVGIAAPEQRIGHYPHQLSGGMRQRVVIALALCAEPKLLIADEPTTALDVSIQAQIMMLLRKLCRENGIAIILVTHDMGVIAETADRVAVMYAGRIVEIGRTADIIQRPCHPYTRGLIGAIPRIGHRRRRLVQIEGAMPRPPFAHAGCAFAARCGKADAYCRSTVPALVQTAAQQAACFHLEMEALP